MDTQTRSYKRKFEPQKIELGQLFEKLPPHALEAEMALLGSMLHDWRICGEVLEIVRSGDDFYKQSHGVIYQVLIDLYDQRQSADIVQLTERLKEKNVLEEVGSVAYLAELAEAVPSASAAGHYARIVRDKAVLRRLIEASGKILYDCFHADLKVGDLLDQAMREVFDLAQAGQPNEAASMVDLLHQTMEELTKTDSGAITGQRTSFYELDEMLSGMQPGELLIVAARPSMGKTAFALNVAESIAADDKQGVAVFSLEMSKEQLAKRMLCSRAMVDAHRVRRNMLNEAEVNSLWQAAGELSAAPIYIDDTPGLSLLQLRAKARRLASTHDIKCLIIDYLQLMSAPGSESRQQEVSNLSRGVKALARELKVPVVCLSQLNRAAEQREGHRPRMSDLRESGSIEQDADVIMMLHREAYYHRNDPNWVRENPDKANLAEVIVAKQRNGPTGVVPLIFDGGSTRFKNAARDRNYDLDE